MGAHRTDAWEEWFDDEDGDEPTRVVTSGVSDEDHGLVPVHRRDGTTVYMTADALSRISRIPVRDLMQPRPDVLGVAEQAQLQEMTDGKFTTWSEAKAFCAAEGMRFVEQGDFQDKQRKALREWAREPEATRGPRPGPKGADRSMFKAKAPSIRKLFKEMWE